MKYTGLIAEKLTDEMLDSGEDVINLETKTTGEVELSIEGNCLVINTEDDTVYVKMRQTIKLATEKETLEFEQAMRDKGFLEETDVEQDIR